MPAKLERPSRKNNLRLKDDLHVKINETPAAASSPTPGEGGRYVYGIVRSKGAMNFGSTIVEAECSEWDGKNNPLDTSTPIWLALSPTSWSRSRDRSRTISWAVW